jgi:hypothetical protein
MLLVDGSEEEKSRYGVWLEPSLKKGLDDLGFSGLSEFTRWAAMKCLGREDPLEKMRRDAINSLPGALELRPKPQKRSGADPDQSWLKQDKITGAIQLRAQDLQDLGNLLMEFPIRELRPKILADLKRQEPDDELWEMVLQYFQREGFQDGFTELWNDSLEWYKAYYKALPEPGKNHSPSYEKARS